MGAVACVGPRPYSLYGSHECDAFPIIWETVCDLSSAAFEMRMVDNECYTVACCIERLFLTYNARYFLQLREREKESEKEL